MVVGPQWQHRPGKRVSSRPEREVVVTSGSGRRCTDGEDAVVRVEDSRGTPGCWVYTASSPAVASTLSIVAREKLGMETVNSESSCLL